MGWHALRHSCASLLVASGIPMRAVSEQLGHSQMALTSDLYSHVAPAMLEENAAALERALSRREG
jgi:integrase